MFQRVEFAMETPGYCFYRRHSLTVRVRTQRTVEPGRRFGKWLNFYDIVVYICKILHNSPILLAILRICRVERKHLKFLQYECKICFLKPIHKCLFKYQTLEGLGTSQFFTVTVITWRLVTIALGWLQRRSRRTTVFK